MSATERSTARRAGSYILEAIAAVALCYFLLGGSMWSPAAWAAFSVLAVAIVAVQVLYDTGGQSELENSLWKLRFAFVLVAGLLVGGVWQQSLWLIGLGVLLGWFWLGDLRAYRETSRLRPNS